MTCPSSNLFFYRIFLYYSDWRIAIYWASTLILQYERTKSTKNSQCVRGYLHRLDHSYPRSFVRANAFSSTSSKIFDLASKIFHISDLHRSHSVHLLRAFVPCANAQCTLRRGKRRNVSKNDRHQSRGQKCCSRATEDASENDIRRECVGVRHAVQRNIKMFAKCVLMHEICETLLFEVSLSLTGEVL